MPVRDVHGDERMDAGKREQDFELRRPRDAPVHGREKRYRQNGTIDRQQRAEPRPGDGSGSGGERAEYERFGRVERSASFSDTERLHPEPDKTVQSGENGKRRRLDQHGNQYQQRFQEAAQAEDAKENSQGAVSEKPGRNSKLEFTANELPVDRAEKKLAKARQRAERTEQKLEKAEARLPARRKLRLETEADPQTGKGKRRLKFEKEVKSQSAHVKGALPLRPVKAAANAATAYAHRKVYQAEDENVGVKAAHRMEMAGEAGARTVYRRHRTRPYRRVERLQKRSVRARAKAAYHQALQENPQLKKNIVSRMWQKRKLKRKYAKAAREAQKIGKRVKNTAVTTERLAVHTVLFVKRHPVIFGILTLLLLLVFLISSALTSCSSIGSGSLGAMAASTYLADDHDINQAELAYTEWETDLQLQINRVETERPGYDEYRYQIDAVEHDPYELMGYLTAVYQHFTYEQVESALRELFAEQYTLTFTEETETRSRTETQTDPETGETTEVEVPYEWKILNVELDAVPIANLIVARMTEDQKEICEILLQTKGNRQYVQNVFGTNWLPYVTSYYGYRIHPISGEKNYHTGIDIAMAQGTDILAGHDGEVTLAGEAGGYGLCVAIKGEAYEDHTLTTKYGHCSQLLVSVGQEVKAGDVIARVGNTGNSTGAHLHLEVLLDGEYVNPMYFADTGDTTERHLPDLGAGGAGGSGNYLDYDIPPEALEDEEFAAMIAEAKKYLGYPYVWAGSNPSTSFDCSGYVSWVINNCGVGWNVGRLTADGLLGVCTPVSREEAKHLCGKWNDDPLRGSDFLRKYQYKLLAAAFLYICKTAIADGR